MAGTTIAQFNQHAQAYQKASSRNGVTIEPKEAAVLGRLYGDMTAKDQKEVRRTSKDSPELTRVLGEIDPKMTNQI